MDHYMVLFDKIGLILFHFAWQAVVIAFITASILLFIKGAGSKVRYNICCVSLLLMMTLPLYFAFSSLIIDPHSFIRTADRQFTPVDTKEVFNNGKLIGMQFRTSRIQISSYEELNNYINKYTPIISIIWLIGVVITTVYRINGFWKVRSIVRQALKLVDSFWEIRIKKLIHITGINRKITILQSLRIDSPAVIGFFKPVLLIPVSFLTGVESKYIEAILLHELAHIKRYDYLINVIQLIIETLGFFHPAVWWISNRIRLERENCCDDYAVEILGDKLIYAKSLVQLEEMRQNSSFVIAANGSSLSYRVSRLLGKNSYMHSSPFFNFAISSVVTLFLIASLGFVMTNSSDGRLTSNLLKNFSYSRLDDNLAMYFPFNGNANDESIFKVKTYTHDVVLCEDRFGRKNRAFDFNGKNSYICTDNNNVIDDAKSITISCWVYPRKIKNWASWICKAGPKWASEWRIGFGENNNYEWGFTMCNLHSGQNMWRDYWITNTELNVNKWTHVAVSANQNTNMVTVYMDGKKIGALKNLQSFEKSGRGLMIGFQKDDFVYFDGKIDDIRIYNRVLSDEEISEVFDLN